MKRPSLAEKSEMTRQRLVDVARGLFAERGYAATGTEDLVERVGLTRGALYHHFRDKEDLFRAVVERAAQLQAERIAAAAAAAADPFGRLRAGCEAFLDSCTTAEVQRILLLDAPSVLGWATWREIDARYCFGMLRRGLQAAMECGAIAPQPVGVLAHLLVAALSEAALVIAQAQDVHAMRAEVGASVERLLACLLYTSDAADE